MGRSLSYKFTMHRRQCMKSSAHPWSDKLWSNMYSTIWTSNLKQTLTHTQIGHHQPPLVLSLSQIQSGGGLLIVNPHGPGGQNDHHQQQQQQQQGGHGQMNGLTPLPPATPDVNGHLLHSAGSTRSDTSSNSPLDSSGGLTNVGAVSPVSSAVIYIFWFCCLPFLVKLTGVANWLLGFDMKTKSRAIIFGAQYSNRKRK